MSFHLHHSTPKHGLNATRQASRESGGSQKFSQEQDESRLEERETCPNCGSTSLLTGVGRKPGEMSIRCSECKAFAGYKNLEKLQRLQKIRHKKALAPCIKFLEECGITAIDEIVFVLSEVGQMP
jgi:transcription elongation factor Elf1